MKSGDTQELAHDGGLSPGPASGPRRARGPRGLGSIEERNGYFYWRRSRIGRDGRRRQWRSRPFETRADAEAARARHAALASLDGDTLTWGEWFDIWLPDTTADLEAQGRSAYARLLDQYVRLHLRPNLTHPIGLTTSADLDRLWLELMRTPLSLSYVENIRFALNKAAVAAQEAQVIWANPVPGSRVPRLAQSSRALSGTRTEPPASLAPVTAPFALTARHRGVVDAFELEARVRALGRALRAHERRLPTFDAHRGDATPYIELRGPVMHYVLSERGQELERRTTTDVDELLYWVAADLTFELACDWEVRHRNDDEDFRIGLFTKQFELLASLSPEWVARRKADLGTILTDIGLD
jgi:hypothetical protein